MAKFIKTIVDRVQFAIKKGLTGYISPSKLMDEVHAESLNLWKKYVDEYERTKKINLYLSPFEKTEMVTALSGTEAEGFKETLEAYRYPVSVIANGLEVTNLTIGEYTYRKNHPIKGPSTEYPISKFVGKTIFIAPKMDVAITYLSKPLKPLYATIPISGNQYAYDDENSIDIEWDEVLHDEIMNRVLANIGINMRESDLVQYSQVEKQQEGK